MVITSRVHGVSRMGWTHESVGPRGESGGRLSRGALQQGIETACLARLHDLLRRHRCQVSAGQLSGGATRSARVSCRTGRCGCRCRGGLELGICLERLVDRVTETIVEVIGLGIKLGEYLREAP